jgi:hypothetical protein
MSRRLSFDRAARALLNSTVRVTHGGSLIIDGWRVCIQPRSAWSANTEVGRYTDASLWLFGHAESGNGVKILIRKGAKVEDMVDGLARRVFEVTDDPENFDGVFLAVPLRPRRMGAA